MDSKQEITIADAQYSQKSDSFRETSSLMSKFMTQRTFDNMAMILAEVIGTGTLMFLGCMGCVGLDDVPSGFSTAIVFGFTVMMIIQMFGHVSYALLNPAVVICAVFNNLISIKVSNCILLRLRIPN